MYNGFYGPIPFRQLPIPKVPIDTNTYLKKLFTKLIGYRVDILLNGRESVFKNLKILKVENGVVYTEAEEDICVIPIRFVATVFMSKSLAKKLCKL